MKGLGKFAVLLSLSVVWGTLSAQPAEASVKPVGKHALVKTAKFLVSPVTHRRQVAKAVAHATTTTLKDTVGSILFGLEEGVDSVHFVLDGLVQITASQQDYFGVIYKGINFADYIAGETDTALEDGELFFFRRKN